MAILLDLPILPAAETLPDNPQPIRVRFPFGIQVESPRTSMRRVPTSDEMLAPLLAQVNALIAPFAPIMVLGGVVVALINTVKSVKDSISQLSPSPMITAIEELLKKALMLAQFVPGVPYVIMIRDIVVLVESVITTARDMVSELATDITAIATTLAGVAPIAGTPAEQAVQALARAALDDVQKRWSALSSALGALTTLVCTLMIPLQILAALAPPQLQQSIDQVRCQLKTFLVAPTFTVTADAAADLAALGVVLTDLSAGLDSLLGVLQTLDEIVSLVIGETQGEVAAKIDCFSDCP